MDTRDFDRRRSDFDKRFDRQQRFINGWFVFVAVLIVVVLALVIAGALWLGPELLDVLRTATESGDGR